MAWGIRTRAAAVGGLAALAAGIVFAAGELGGSEPSLGRATPQQLRELAAKLKRPPRAIVMVVFDELPLTSLLGPDGQIDAERYPAFAQLAERSLWYRNATAVHDSTGLAVPAILDGRYPRPGVGGDFASHPRNLFTLLAGRYAMRVSEEATGLCPPSVGCDPLPGTTLHRLAHGRVERFRRFVRSIHPRRERTLWFKHVLLPHVPWRLLPSGRSYRRTASEPIHGLNSYRGFGVPWLVQLSYQRHLLQLGFADRLLGELLARLRRAGMLDRALVVAVADHGIAFDLGRDRRRVTPRNVEDLAPVPLLVKLPGQRRGFAVDSHVETIDVLPTLLRAARVPAPDGLDGRSLLRPAAVRPVTVFHRIGNRLNTVGGRYTFTADFVERRREAALERKLELFGSGGGRDPERLYEVGPFPELVGRLATDVPLLRGRHRARVHQAAQLRRVRPASGFVPAQITGRIRPGRRGGGRAVALVLNGRVATVGRSFSLAGSRAESFAAVVPEWMMRAGANRLRVFEVLRRGDGPALRPL